MNIRQINEMLFERCCSIGDEFPEMSLKGEIVDCKIFKNNVGISFKIKDEYGMFNCKCWNYKNIDIFTIKESENSTCIISGFIKVNYFNNHYDFVLELNKDIIKENNKSIIKSLKENCESRGYLINKKPIDWNSISKIGLISKKDTQGYNDFIKQLKVDFQIILKEIVLEGVNTEKTLIDAINEFQDEDVEAILIIRGGGSTIEISNSYDKMSIFEVIRNSNKPIITAIGHEADKDEKLLITSISDVDYPTPSRLAIEINKNKLRIIEEQLKIIKDKFMKKEYLILSIYVDKWIKEKYGAMIININEDDKFLIIENNERFYKMKLNFKKSNEIFITKDDIRMKKMIEEGIKNYDINLVKKFRDYLKDKTDLNEMIKEIIDNIIEFNELKGEGLKLEEIGENNYKDLYKYYLNKKDILS
jgi:exodeoxyribonuclease VII large subunit